MRRRFVLGISAYALAITLALALGTALAWVIKRAGTERPATEARPARAAAGTMVLVANRQDGTLTFIDAARCVEVGKIDAGYHPHDVAIAPDGRTAYVASYNAGESILVIDVAAREELRRIDLGRNRDPLGIQVSRDGTRLYVTPEDSQAVLEIDAATGNVIRSLDTGREVSRMFVLAPDGRRLYTTHPRNGLVTAVDLDQNAAATRIPVRRGCEGIDVTPDGRAVWTANTYADTITVIDTTTLTAVAHVPCPGRPSRVKFVPDGKTAVVLYSEGMGGLAFFDVANRRLTQNGNAGLSASLAIDPTGQILYLTRGDLDGVVVFELDRLDGTYPTIRTGRGPDGIAVAVPR